MTDTMLERMCRAMCLADGHDPDGPTCDVYIPGDPHAGLPWAGYRAKARAALEAIRKPSEAAWLVALDFDTPDDLSEVYPQDYTAMIDAILNGKA